MAKRFQADGELVRQIDISILVNFTIVICFCVGQVACQFMGQIYKSV